jgi:hypothetical protein
MKTPGLFVLAGLLATLLAGCACPRCPVDSVDGVGVAVIRNPNSSERGALAAVLGVLYAQTGPESAEVRAVDTALGQYGLVTGGFHSPPDNPDTRGYVLMKDGRIAVDATFIRAAPPDSDYLADRRTWPLFPVLYAAGCRLVHGGAWRDSISSAADFAEELAAGIEAGRITAALPPDTDLEALARFLREWRNLY